MGPELGSDCRDLVMPIVVTQGIYFDLFGYLVLFFNPSSWLIRRRCISQVPDLSLSQRPLVSLKCLYLTTCLSLGKGPRLPATRSLLLQLPSLPTASTVFPCPWDGQGHLDFSSFSLGHPGQKGYCPPHVLRRTRSLRTQSLFHSAFGPGVICRSEGNLVLMPLLSMHSIFEILLTNFLVFRCIEFFWFVSAIKCFALLFFFSSSSSFIEI